MVIVIPYYQQVFYNLLYALNLFIFWQEDFPHGAHHREIAISVSNYTLKHGDAGLIIVGGRMEMQHHLCCLLIFLSFKHYMMNISITLCKGLSW